MCDEQKQKRFAVGVLALVSFFVGCGQSPQVVGPNEWPSPMSELLARYPKIAKSITTYKHDASVNSKFAWKIVGQADEIDRFIEDLNLQETAADHVKYKELQRSIPDAWILPKTKDTRIYASEGYDDEHQEGIDLILLVRAPGVNETLVLYEWIF